MKGYLFALAGALTTLAFMFELLRRRRLREKWVDVTPLPTIECRVYRSVCRTFRTA